MTKSTTFILLFTFAVSTLFAAPIEKALLYDQHTLSDTYPYGDTIREFQWDRIQACLNALDGIQQQPNTWAILQNYHNINGVAPLVEHPQENEYKLMADTFGVERYQSIPLYLPGAMTYPERYVRDGSVVQVIQDSLDFVKVSLLGMQGEWLVPDAYIKVIDATVFTQVIFVDRTNQNITTLEKVDQKWLVRSMNPCTTGRYRPPYQYQTPVGIFIIQARTPRMVYLSDGTSEVGGFAPYASRFTGGGYLHGVPIDLPRTEEVEFSPSLGTTPRSHKCVRNATSHARFIYNWAQVEGTLVFVLD